MIEETKTEKPENAGKIQVKRDKGGKFVKGFSGNPNGKPLGAKSFSTIFDETIKEIAKAKKITPIEAEKELIKMAYMAAKKGNFNFFKDLMDRKYGKAMESIDFTSGGEALGVIILPIKKKQDGSLLESPAETRDSPQQ